jgi:O-antigen/teichoic acid export membrane protein
MSETDVGGSRGLRWIQQGFWAVADQGAFAGSNFLVNVMLARLLRAADYGAFSVAFALFILLSTSHTGMLSDPMLVFGSGKYRDRSDRYLSTLLLVHAGLSTSVGLLLVAAGLGAQIVGSPALSPALVALGVSAPFILLSWLMRRMCYVRLQPRRAATAGCGYLVLVTLGLLLLSWTHYLSAVSGLAVMGAAGLGTGAWLGMRLGIPLPSRPSWREISDVLRDHWQYGRWSTSALALAWAPAYLYLLMLPLWWGLQATAMLRALMNLILPIQHADAALSVLLIPVLVRARGTAAFRRITRNALICLTGGSAACWLVVLAFHRHIAGWLYHGQYTDHGGVLWLLGALPLAAGVAGALAAAFQALERPEQVLKARVAATAVTLTLGVWWTARWGIVGAGAGLALSALTAGAAMWQFYRQPAIAGARVFPPGVVEAGTEAI